MTGANCRCRNLSAHMPQSHRLPTLMATTGENVLGSCCFRPTTIFESRQMSRDERGNEAAEILSCHDKSVHSSQLLPTASPTL